MDLAILRENYLASDWSKKRHPGALAPTLNLEIENEKYSPKKVTVLQLPKMLCVEDIRLKSWDELVLR